MINTVGLKGWETTIPSPFPPDPSTNSVCVVSVLTHFTAEFASSANGSDISKPISAMAGN